MSYLLLLVLLLLVLLFAPLPAFGQEPTRTPAPAVSIVLVPDIFVRGGPARTYIPVGRLIEGDVVFPVGRNAEANWVMIRYNAGFGWIRRDLAFWTEDIDRLPVVDPQNLTPSPVPGEITVTPFLVTATPQQNWVRVGSGGAFVRAGPGRGYLRLDTLFNGDVIEEPVGRNEDTTWIMFRHDDGFGWIAANLVNWVDDVDNLPMLTEDALTPTLTYTPSDTPTATPTPSPTATDTDTPTLTATDTATATPSHTSTPTATATPSSTATATDTSTPIPMATESATPTLTQTATHTPLPASTATHTSTVTATQTGTNTPTDEPTPTETVAVSPTHTITATHTATESPSDTATSTSTPLPTDTPTVTESPTETDQPTATRTRIPSPTVTVTESPTQTPEPTRAVALAASPTRRPTASDTPQPTDTITPTVTNTPTGEPTATETNTPLPTEEDTATPTASRTPRPTATNTVIASETVADTPEMTATRTPRPTVAEFPTQTETPVVADVAPTEPGPEATLVPETVDDDGGGVGVEPEAVVGIGAILAVLAYVGLYLRGLAAADRYASGFAVDTCPVCRRGQLHVDQRQERILGIPRPRRIVRCDNCRSLLRETGHRRWRYAVDPVANPAIFERYNGQEIDEETLVELLNRPPEPVTPEVRPPAEPPTFVDHD